MNYYIMKVSTDSDNNNNTVKLPPIKFSKFYSAYSYRLTFYDVFNLKYIIIVHC